MVKDTGEGMTPAELGRVFERFYQVDKARTGGAQRGSGLGLAIVQELVALHNGRIQAQSQPGQGSAFIVRLPLSSRPEPSTLIRRDE